MVGRADARRTDPDGDALTVNGRTIGENCRGRPFDDDRGDPPVRRAAQADAGFVILRGNLFDAAIMKTSA